MPEKMDWLGGNYDQPASVLPRGTHPIAGMETRDKATGVTRRGARDDNRETSGGAGYFNLPRGRITYEKSVTLHRKIVNLLLLYIRTRVDVRCATSVSTVACGFLVSGGSLRLLAR